MTGSASAAASALRVRLTEWPALGTRNDPVLELPRPIALDDASDVAMLVAAVERDHPRLASQVPAYLRFFAGPPWRAVSASGIVDLLPGAQPPLPIHLTYLLRIAGYLRDLEGCSGFGALIRGLTNPPQFRSSAFEVQVAHWCLTRPGTRGVEIRLPDDRGERHHDFTWRYASETVHCECKRAEIFENAAVSRLERLADLIDDVYMELGGWSDDVRLDVRIRGMPSAFRDQLVAIVRDLRTGQLAAGSHMPSKDFALTVRPRAEGLELPATSWRVIGSAIPAGIQRSVDDPREAHYTVEFDVRRHLTRITRRLMRDSRTQLPPDAPGGVFLQLIGRPVIAEVERLLALPNFSHVAFTAMWGRDEPLSAVYRKGQPFDASLLRSQPAG